MVALIPCYEGREMVTAVLEDGWNATGGFMFGKSVLEMLKNFEGVSHDQRSVGEMGRTNE